MMHLRALLPLLLAGSSIAASGQSVRGTVTRDGVRVEGAIVLLVDSVGRVVARDYHQNGRTDVSEIISGTATYRMNDWCSLSAIGSFAHSDSNQDVFDYDVGNVGGAFQLSIRF